MKLASILVFLLLFTTPGDAQTACSFGKVDSAPAIPEGFGVNIDFTDPRPGEIRMIAEAGFRWVRMDLKWDATETEKGTFDFSSYDRLMSALDSARLRALFILDYGNPLYDNGAPPRTALTRRAFARWAVAAAKHFAGRGVLWEIYNEPNHDQFWPPRSSATDYVALALEVGRAFREAVPAEQMIGPATAGIDFEFLSVCFKAGLLNYWSAVSIHPYRREDPETVTSEYCRLQKMIQTFAPVVTGSRDGGVAVRKEIPILSSEWGYSTAWPRQTEELQGQMLARSFLTNAASGVRLSIWYDWRDDGVNESDPEHHFGTVLNFYHRNRPRPFEPKRAFLAAKTLTTFFSGYRFEKRLDVGSDDYVLVFRKGNDLRVAAWSVAKHERRVVIALDGGQYVVISYTGERVGTIATGEKGVALRLTSAPVYLRKKDLMN